MHSKVKNCSGAATRILCVEWSRYAGLGGGRISLLKCDILYQHFACYIQCAFYCFQLLEWVQERVLGLGDSITTLLTLMAMGEDDG